jgi:type 1 glutamine amidotransferase
MKHFVCAVLVCCAWQARAQNVKRVVIVTGENSYAGHVWKETSAEIKSILEADKNLRVTLEPDPNFIAAGAFLGYDAAVFDFRNAKPLEKDEKVQANILKFLGDGKGLVVIHWADGAFPYWPEFVNIVGRAQQSKHDPRGPFAVQIVNHNHPVTRGMKDFQTDDELYYDTKEGDRPIEILATAHSKVMDKDFPMALTVQYGRGRVFNTPMGHDVKALRVPEVAELIRHGTAWAAGQ